MEVKIIDTKRFVKEINKASSDCSIKGKDELAYGITLDRIIDMAFDCLIETEENWKYQDPIKILNLKLKNVGK